MSASSLQDQVTEMVSSLFRRGSRYQTEKLATVGAYIVLSIASLVWAFSGSNSNNQLGATFQKTQIEEIDQDVYSLRNDSGDDWTQVRVVLNRRYLYKRDVLKARNSATLGRKDFAYFYYIPRAWGLNNWEQLAKEEKPGETAPANLEIKFVQLRAREGKLDIDKTREAKAKP